MIRLGLTIILFAVFWGCSTESEKPPIRPISCEQALDLDSPLMEEVQLLGIPLEGRYASEEMAYARNIWDMRLVGDRLYLGGGNSSNHEPASNAGPVPVVAWDLGTKQFVEEYDVDDEQIDRFYVFDNSLVIPGHDSRQSWASGTLYRKDASGWNSLGEIPHAIHVYAMTQFDGQLLAGLGTPAGSGVAYSLDGGLSWETNYLGGLRIHEFFQLNGTVFALDIFASEFDLPSVFEMETKDEWKERLDLSVETLFPGVELDGRTIRVVRSAALAEAILYIGGYTHNDHQFLPFGLFAADDLSAGAVRLTEVEFPEDWKPWDLVEKDDRVYVLANKSIETGALWHSSILEISSNGECTEVRRFQGDAVARSFEMNADTIWVSFGAETPIAEVESQELGFSRNLGMLGQLPR